MSDVNSAHNSFLTDVQILRDRAKQSLEDGAVTTSYGGDVAKTIELLQTVVATELVCVLRYTMHSIAVVGMTSESVSKEFKEHADDEREHMMLVANRIDELGGTPDFSPDGLSTRSMTEYGSGGDLVAMAKENLVAERGVIEHYLELIRYFASNDPTTRVMMEQILADEEDHATDMHDILVAHEGRPFLQPEV